jgi:hypothetical protein
VQRFEVVESYLHQSAKDVVCRWIQELSAAAQPGEWIRLQPLHFRPGRWYAEYPICADLNGVNPVWDELDEFRERCPTYDEAKAAGYTPKAVVDVGVIHKGVLRYAIEVVHKNPTPPWKRALLSSLDVQLIEVSALGVMRQVKRPQQLPLWQPGRAA